MNVNFGKKIFLMGLMIWVLFCGIFLLGINFLAISANSSGSSISLESTYSTVIGSPANLNNDNETHENFNVLPNQDFYYRSWIAASTYTLFWINCDNPGDNNQYNLSVYSDAGFSVLVDSMVDAAEVMDWVVYRKDSSQGYVYPLVHTSGSVAAGAYIEAEMGPEVGGISTTSVSLNDTDVAEIYAAMALNPAVQYTVALTVPAACDFDLYVFYLTEGSGESGSNPDYSSESAILGQDEAIIFQPPVYGHYAVVALRRSGSGTGTLSIRYVQPPFIPGFEFLPLMFGIAILALCGWALQRRKRNLNL